MNIEFEQLEEDLVRCIITDGNSIYFGTGQTEEKAKDKAYYNLTLSKIPKKGPGLWQN